MLHHWQKPGMLFLSPSRNSKSQEIGFRNSNLFSGWALSVLFVIFKDQNLYKQGQR